MVSDFGVEGFMVSDFGVEGFMVSDFGVEGFMVSDFGPDLEQPSSSGIPTEQVPHWWEPMKHKCYVQCRTGNLRDFRILPGYKVLFPRRYSIVITIREHVCPG